MADEAIWKKRFGLFMLARLVGLATFLAGIGVAYTDVLRPGGWPTLGSILIICGVIDAVFAPRLMKKHWQKIDAQQDSGPGTR